MKFLLLIVVIGIALWMFKTRGRKSDTPDSPVQPSASQGKKSRASAPTPMLACAHCGVHLPQADTVTDAAGRPFCTEAHRLAGPR